jgi:hypothetical protein
VTVEDQGEQVALVFSSVERAIESIRRQNGPVEAFSPVAIAAPAVLNLVGKLNLCAGPNYGCSDRTIILPPGLLSAWPKAI